MTKKKKLWIWIQVHTGSGFHIFPFFFSLQYLAVHLSSIVRCDTVPEMIQGFEGFRVDMEQGLCIHAVVYRGLESIPLRLVLMEQDSSGVLVSIGSIPHLPCRFIWHTAYKKHSQLWVWFILWNKCWTGVHLLHSVCFLETTMKYGFFDYEETTVRHACFLCHWHRCSHGMSSESWDCP